MQMVLPLIRIKDFVGARKYIVNNLDKVIEEEQEHTNLYLRGTILFFENNLQEAMKIFLKLRFQFPSQPSISANLNSRQLLSRIYFDLHLFFFINNYVRIVLFFFSSHDSQNKCLTLLTKEHRPE